MTMRRVRLRKAIKAIVNSVHQNRGTPIPVFLFGEMRSGTNMLFDSFDSCMAADTFNETDPAAFVDYELRDLGVIRSLIDRSRATHVVLKPTADTNRASELLDAFPRSRSIWIYRDYKDAVNSAIEKWQQHNEYLRLIIEEPTRARWRARNLSAADLQLIRLHYARGVSEPSARALIWYLRNAPYVTERLFERRDLLLANYEMLVTNPDHELRRVFDFLGLPFRERYLRHISTGSVRKKPSPTLDPDIDRLCVALTTQLHAALRNQLDRITERTVAAPQSHGEHL